mgnify:FL=1
MEEAAEQGDGTDLFLSERSAYVLLQNLLHLAVPATSEDQAAQRPRDSWEHSLATAEGSLLLTDVRLLLRERPCTVGDSHDIHLVARKTL